MKKLLLTAAVMFVAANANAAPVSTGGSFTMYNGATSNSMPSLVTLDLNGVVPGSQGVMNVDNTITGWVDQAAGTWGVSSTNKFNGAKWTATGGKLLTTPGSYALDTATGNVVPGTGTVAYDGKMNFTVNPGQVAGTINFAWQANSGIRIVNVWNAVSSWGGYPNPLVLQSLSLTCMTAPAMENGPFPTFQAAFNLSTVPEPASMLLLGSGLAGLVAVRKKRG